MKRFSAYRLSYHSVSLISPVENDDKTCQVRFPNQFLYDQKTHVSTPIPQNKISRSLSANSMNALLAQLYDK
jgi:hypothetical protein